MKKILTAFAAVLLFAACTSVYDDTALKDRVSSLETRVTTLEGSMSALQSAIGDGVFAKKVEEYVDPETGKTTGVKVTYTSGEVKYFTIHADIDVNAPVLTVMKNGAGDLCWAIDGVIVQVGGVDVTVYQTPTFNIDEEGNVTVTIDGKTTQVGKIEIEEGGATLQDGIFTNIKVEADKIVLTLSDNTVVNIPFAEAFKLNIGTTEFEYNSLDPITIPYTVSAKTAGTVVGVSGYNPKAFKVEVDDAKIVITPLKLTESVVLLAYADSKVGLTSFVNITIEAEEVEVGPKNLGKKESANCYIVTEAGDYKFPAVKGNSAESVGAVASAAVVWETWNNDEAVTAGSVIAFVSVEDGFVVFSTPETLKPGNALIAAKDASDAILWSWHIWIPATPITTNTYGLWNTPMMDRNLGALVAAVVGEPATSESFGTSYQWGRKDPFVGPKSASSGSNATVAGTEVTKIDATMTIEETIAQPTVIGHTNDADWLTGESDNTLWQNDVKTVYDPCPPGYKVPARDKTQPLMSGDLSALAGWSEDAANGYITIGDPVAVFPVCGYRDDYSPGSFSKVYQRVAYWSSYASGTVKAYLLNIRLADYGNAHTTGEGPKARGGFVRCVELAAE